METDRKPVSRQAIEALWRSVEEKTADPGAGLFGPESVSWKVNRESALFLGAGRAALLQLAHPWVAAALDQHSNLRADPLARFHNTFRVVFTMVFGTAGQALAASRSLYQLHTRIQGEIPEKISAYAQGSRYQANELNALTWVYTTLIDSALIAYESVLPPLTPDEREGYYAESKTMAALFGIPATALPGDWSGFSNYLQAMLASDQLGVNELSRTMAHRVLHGHGSWVPIPAWYRALTASWLPARLRTEFALNFPSNLQSIDGSRDGSRDASREEARATRARHWLPRLYRRLPALLRFVGPYHEALSRLDRRRAGPLTRASNRFWMGQPYMMFAQDEPAHAPESKQPVQ